MSSPFERHVLVCTSGKTCPTQGSEAVHAALKEACFAAGLDATTRVNKAGCFSQCGHGPMIVVYPENVWYAGVQESDLAEIVTSHIVGGCPVERLRYAPGVRGANKIDAAHTATPAAAATPAQPAWKRVCASADVPANGMKEFVVGRLNILVVHTGEAYAAFQALCPHEAIPLESGVHDGCTLTCLEHMWQFDLQTGAPMGDAQEGLKTYPLKEERGELYVAL